MNIKTVEPIFDVVVAGGGTAGCVAAISAARQGARVCLVEQTAMLGGNGTSGMVTQIFGPKKHFGGIGVEVIDSLRVRGGVGPTVKPGVYWWVPYQNEAMKLLWDDMVSESGVDLYLCTKLIDVTKAGAQIRSMTVVGPEGCFEIGGTVFIDTTGDGVLSCLAGEEHHLGDENGATQAPSMEAYYANVDFEKFAEFIQRELSKVGSYVGIFHNYIAKAVQDGILREEDLHHPGAYRIGDNLALMNVGHVYGADCTTAGGLTQATLVARKLAHEYLAFYRQYIPGFEQAVLVSTASWLGIRESRRIVCRYMIKYDDKKCYRKFDDAVMRFTGGSRTDLHASSPKREDYQRYFTLFTTDAVAPDPDDYCTLPYRCLVACKTENLLVAGRCLSADRETQAALRVMGYCMMMGQVTGAAAAAAVRQNTVVAEINVPTLQARLRDDGIVNI